MKILSFAGGVFAENCHLVICEETGEAVAIDPGAAAPSLVAALAEHDARLVAILLTHAHLDHVEGIPRVLEAARVPIWLHPDDQVLYRMAPSQAEAFGLPAPDLPPADRELVPGETFAFGEVEFDILFAPGHAPGHVVFVHRDSGTAFVGDVIFRGSIGRADLPGGDFRQLMTSIREQILTLPDDTRLITGHGPETTVSWERRTNPFLTPQYGGELV